MQPLIVKTFPVWDSDRPVLDMLANGRKLQHTYIHEYGKTSMVVSGTEKRLQRFEEDLEVNKLVRVRGALENVAKSVHEFAKRVGKVSGAMNEDWNTVTVERNANRLVITVEYLEGSENVSYIPDCSGVLGEVRCAEEDRVCLDTEEPLEGENGYLPDDDSGRSKSTGETTGETVVVVPEKGEWVTETEYAERHRVPRSTVNYWVRNGYLECDSAAQPRLVFDGQKVPIRDRDGGQKPSWIWVDRDILADANSLVD